MGTALRVLLIEDSEDDAALLVRELRRGGYEPTWRRVDTAEALHAALDGASWDLVTCDWVMPGFSAPAALRLLRERGCELPILIVSGEVGEEAAVSAMKNGAHDYVSKHNLTRLLPAIERELRESAERQARQRAEASLRRTQERLQTFIEQASDLIFTLDGEGRVTSVNRAVSEVTGYAPQEVIGRRAVGLIVPHGRERGARALRAAQAGEAFPLPEFELVAKDGTTRVLEVRGHAVHRDGGGIESFHIARDITERRRAEAERARLSAALERAPEPIAITDAQGLIIYLNPAGEQLLGRSRSELQGRPCAELRRAAEAQQLVLALVEVTVVPVHDGAGRVIDYVGRRSDEPADGPLVVE